MFHHGPNGGNLRRVLAEIVEAGIAPPIPATARVEGIGLGLRKQDDQAVGIGDLGKARSLDERIARRISRTS